MRIVVVGSGGREHAFAHAFRHFGHQVRVTPGNAGIPGSVADAPESLVAATDLFVVGPEAPLVDGLADRLRAAGALVFGPGVDGAQLEGSKAWMKDVLVAAGVPTAHHGTFEAHQLTEALEFLRTMIPPYVVKTDGLAAGKGVVVTSSLADAELTVASYLSGEAFGAAGSTCVIEEGLIGTELSVFAICDGHRAVLCGSAQDHKRIGDGDTGPNTGGMGAFSPVADLPPDLESIVLHSAIEPTLAELRRRGIDYRGVLFCGLMLTSEGPKVLEYNIRFGDPEAQAILPRVTSDLAVVMAEAAAGELRSAVTLSSDATVCVVLAAENYPAPPRTGDRIEGLAVARAQPGITVFAAGVGADPNGGASPDGDTDLSLVTAGGRVLNVVGRGRDVAEARTTAYDAVRSISWPGRYHRTDIALPPVRTPAGDHQRSVSP